MKKFLLFVIIFNFLALKSAEEEQLLRPSEGRLPSQTYSHAFRVSGMLFGKHVSFDIFGSCHIVHFKVLHPTLQSFFPNHQHLMLENKNVFGREDVSKAELLREGLCTETVNPYLEDLNLNQLKSFLKEIDTQLKKEGFKGIENLTILGFYMALQSEFAAGESEIVLKMKMTPDTTHFLEEQEKVEKTFDDMIAAEKPVWDEKKRDGKLLEHLTTQASSVLSVIKSYLAGPLFIDDIFVKSRNKEWEPRLFNFIKLHSNALVIAGSGHLYHREYGLLARFQRLGLLVQRLDLKDGGFIEEKFLPAT